jgi:hypothetical protein
VLYGTAAQAKPNQVGQGLEQHVGTAIVQQPAAGVDTSVSVHGKGKTGNQSSVILHGSSSAAGASAQVKNSEIGITSAGATEVTQTTTKMCKQCGVKGHLMFECTATVFCEICRSTDHAMVRCPVLKQPKPVVQLVG